MKLKLESLKKSIEALSRSIGVLSLPGNMGLMSGDVQDTIKSGVIRNFRVAYEQAWKMMKRWLENNAGQTQVDGVTRRELFRLAAEHQLIKDVEKWMEFHQARNESSHTYDGEVAKKVLAVAGKFVAEAKIFLSSLEPHKPD